MTTFLRRSRQVETVSYSLHFDRQDAPGCGFAFPCDEHGTVRTEEMQPAGLVNYEACLANTFSVPMIRKGIVTYRHSYREPAIIECGCGKPLTLHDVLTNECVCGRFYNGGGQALCHPRLWGEETGERFDDHGHAIL